MDKKTIHKSRRFELYLFGLLSIFVIIDLLTAVVFSATFAYLVYPVYNKLKKKTGKENFSAFITTAGTFFVIILPLVFALREIAFNAEAITNFLLNLFATGLAYMGTLGAGISSSGIDLARDFLIGTLSSLLLSIPGIIIQVLIMILLIFYFIRDGNELRDLIYQFTGSKKQEKMLNGLEELFGAVLYGYFTTALILGVLSYLALFFLGYNNALILSIIVGVTGLIPVLGPWVVYIFLVVGAYLQADYLLLVELAVIGIILQMLLMVLPQILVSNKAEVHPVLILLGFIGGPLALGLKGLILGPLILGTFKVMLNVYSQKNNNQ